MKQFGQAGQASKVPVVSLDDMAKAYLAGKYGDSAKPGEQAAQAKR
jgi:fructose-bisphosphate aldolase class II